MMKKLMSMFLMISFLLVVNLLPSVKAEGIQSLDGISLEKAKEIALKQVAGKIISAHVENDDGISKYEVIIQAKDGRYEVEIDKASGKVLEVEKEGKGNRHGEDDDGDDDHDDRYDD